MKKKILGGLLVVAIAAVAAFNVNMNTENNELSMLALANVEALAGSESGTGSGSGEKGTKCYKTITTKESSKVLYCGTCTWVSESTDSWTSGSGTCP